MTPTNPLIAEARRLRAAATQGKWQAWRQGNQYLQPETSNETVVGASVLKPLIRPWSPYAVRVEDPSEVRLTDEDADFSAFAANNILAFADKIEEQEQEIATKTEVFAHAMNLASQHRDELEQQIADLKAALSQISESCLSFVNTQTIPISATARAALLKALEASK